MLRKLLKHHMNTLSLSKLEEHSSLESSAIAVEIICMNENKSTAASAVSHTATEKAGCGQIGG